MSNYDDSLVITKEQQTSVTDFSRLRDKVQQLIEASTASETRRAYSCQLRKFFNWCYSMNISSPFPASSETLAAYIAHLAETNASFSTLEQTLAAVATLHRAHGFDSPTENLLVRKIVKGFKREHGVAPHKNDAATLDIIRFLLNSIPQDNSPKHIRDRAIIALFFAGAFRRSELAALNIENLKWTFRDNRDNQEILIIEVLRSKTDQEAHGMLKAIFPSSNESISPTILLKHWLSISNISSGSLFHRILKGGHVTSQRLTAQSVRLIVQATASAAGLSLNLSTHNLRSGFVTTAIRQGKSERSIMNQTGHKSVQTLRDYFQREDAIEDNAAQNLM